MFILSLVLDVLSLLVALMMLMNPVVSEMTLVVLVAVYLLIFGGNNILVAFAHRL